MTPKEFVFDFVRDNPNCDQGAILSFLSGSGVSRPKASKAIKELCDSGVLFYQRGRYNRFSYIVAQGEYQDAKPNTTINDSATKAEKDFVYGISIVGESPIKIGITKDLKSRLSTMQTGNYKLYYIAFAVLTDRPRELEAELHHKFWHARLRGEWFDISQQDLINAMAEWKV